MPLSDTTANSIINLLFNGTAFTAVNGPWVQLHSGDPGASGTANVIAAGRRQGSFNNAANRQTTNSAALEWVDMPSATVSWFSVWTASTAGNYLWKGQLTTTPGGSATTKSVVAGDTFRVNSGQLLATLPS